MNIFLKLKTIFARQSSAPTEAAQKDKQQIATEARDQAAQALNAEAQAVVDRIRERTQDEADKAKIEALVGECLTIERKMKARKATLTDAQGTVVPLKPARKTARKPVKPKGDDQ